MNTLKYGSKIMEIFYKTKKSHEYFVRFFLIISRKNGLHHSANSSANWHIKSTANFSILRFVISQ